MSSGGCRIRVVFLRGSGSHELAEARLDERISAELSDAIGRRELASLASTDPERWSLDALTREVLDAVAPAARDELGIEVIDVRLRRFTHPIEVRPAVFDLIRSERRQVAAKLRAEGEAEYMTITSQADRARDTTIAEAEAHATGSEGKPRPRRPASSTRPTPATPGSSSSSARSSPIARSSMTSHAGALGVEPTVEVAGPGAGAGRRGRARRGRIGPDREGGPTAMKRIALIAMIGIGFAVAGLSASQLVRRLRPARSSSCADWAGSSSLPGAQGCTGTILSGSTAWIGSGPMPSVA